VKDQWEFLERRRSLLRDVAKESRAMETILLKQGKHLEYERQRQITLDAEAELMEAESEIYDDQSGNTRDAVLGGGSGLRAGF
jgi:hypothetical protein